ncbi:hypothetical protein, partial [Pseudomonas aeruginosa]|uniref:hypothetical protein n=1 Tax=Pseudomonas aeruginosa TaxID=287 RepID=UPI001C4EBD5C
TIPAHRPQDHITLEMAPLEIRHRSVRPISAKHAQASRFLQQSLQESPRDCPRFGAGLSCPANSRIAKTRKGFGRTLFARKSLKIKSLLNPSE